MIFQLLQRRLSKRPDSEHEQALVRLVMLALVMAYLQGVVAGHPGIERPLHLSLWFLMLEFAVAFGILGWLLARPGISPPRRVLGMIADYSLMGVGMVLLGELLAPMYVLLLWVTVGNGLRFGSRYLYVAIGFAGATFITVLLLTPYWKANPWLGWGLLLGLFAVPLYLSSLLHALVKATDAAKAASEAKSRFLANMSHEFRTPLNGIVGMAELLAATRMSREQRDSAEVIRTSARALQLLVDDVLDFSTIEAGKLKRADEDFSLSELVKNVKLVLSPNARDKGLSLESRIDEGVPDCVHGDSGHLRQILVNLLSNAIKFTEKGKVSLHISLLGEHEGALSVRFSVRDTGIGIPTGNLGKIFDAFEQVDSGRDRRFGGTGLGTTIAKVLVELLGGTIAVESELGAGSHFWFDLPLKRGIATPGDSDGLGNIIAFDDPFVRHRARVRPLKVLVADDQAANLLVMRRLLEKAGHHVLTVEDGDGVLSVLEAQNFDLVITDLHMPGISGLEIIKQARFMEAGRRRTPFLVLTADATHEARLESERAGAFAFLTKPLAVDRLLERLAAVAEGVVAAPGKVQEIGPPVRPGAVQDFDKDVTAKGVLSEQILDELRDMKLGEDFVQRFLSECARDARKSLADMEVAGSAMRWDEFRDACHALKGAAGNMGAVQLARIASEGMRMTAHGLRNDWPGFSGQVRQQLQVAISALKKRGDLTRDELTLDGN